MIELIPICESNIALYEVFEKNYSKRLKSYLSRIYPYSHAQYNDLIKQNLLFWDYISVDKNVIGSVWIERKNLSDSSATLGIFIDDESSLGKGIGTHVIKQAVKICSDKMNLQKVELKVRAANLRAYNCYKKCGFSETSRFIKDGSIEAVWMELPI